jgi:arabinose-5-phosphate isomerase
LGIVCVKDKNSIMLLTDGDIRRHSNNLYKKKIAKVATKNPTWVADTDAALSAINTMNSKGITSLLVTKKKDIKKKVKRLVGILHMHTALALGIK